MTVNRSAMIAQLLLHEGCRLSPYLDTEGYWTVGVGYNISGRGWEALERVAGRRLSDQRDVHALAFPKNGPALITRAEALRVLGADLDRLEAALPVAWPAYVGLSEVRRRVALDMAFNMGTKALGFRQAVAAAEAQDWSRCARELYKSKWSRQVGDGPGGKFDRCDRLARMVLTDNPPTDVPPLPDDPNL